MFKVILNLPKNAIDYVKSTFAELRKIEWLKFNKVVRYTILVISVTIIVTLIIVGLDALFTTIRNWLLTL